VLGSFFCGFFFGLVFFGLCCGVGSFVVFFFLPSSREGIFFFLFFPSAKFLPFFCEENPYVPTSSLGPSRKMYSHTSQFLLPQDVRFPRAV